MSDAKPSIESFADLVLSPSLPRFVALSVVLIILVFGFHYFETQTQYFGDQHSANEAELLERLVQIRTDQTLTKTEEEVRSQAVAQMLDRLASEVVANVPPKGWQGFSFYGDRFLYGMIPWLFFGAISAFTEGGAKGRLGVFSAMTIVACIFGAAATLLPFQNLIFKLGAPWVMFFLATAMMLVFAFSHAKQNQEKSVTEGDKAPAGNDSDSQD